MTEEHQCIVCGDPASDGSASVCHRRGNRFPLHERNDTDGKDCGAAWIDEQTFNVEVYITDIHLGGLRISFAFKGEEIGVFMTKQAEFFLDEYSGFAGGRRL